MAAFIYRRSNTGRRGDRVRLGRTNVSPTNVNSHDPTTNMTGAAVVFLIVAIVLGMIAGADMYSIATGIGMLVLVALVYFTRFTAV
jgi:hypothetical protein